MLSSFFFRTITLVPSGIFYPFTPEKWNIQAVALHTGRNPSDRIIIYNASMRKQITITVTFDKLCPEGTKHVKIVLRTEFDVHDDKPEGGSHG